MRIQLLKTQRRLQLLQILGLEEKLMLRTKQLKRIRRKIKKELALILNYHNRELKLLAGLEAPEKIISDLE